MLGMIFVTVLCFVVIFISGFRLSRRGKPYGTLLLTLHKLIPVGVLVYLFIVLRQLRPLSPLTIAVCVLAGMLFLLLIASGGVISAAKEPPAWLKLGHKVLPWLCIAATAAGLALAVLGAL